MIFRATTLPLSINCFETTELVLHSALERSSTLAWSLMCGIVGSYNLEPASDDDDTDDLLLVNWSKPWYLSTNFSCCSRSTHRLAGSLSLTHLRSSCQSQKIWPLIGISWVDIDKLEKYSSCWVRRYAKLNLTWSGGADISPLSSSVFYTVFRLTCAWVFCIYSASRGFTWAIEISNPNSPQETDIYNIASESSIYDPLNFDQNQCRSIICPDKLTFGFVSTHARIRSSLGVCTKDCDIVIYRPYPKNHRKGSGRDWGSCSERKMVWHNLR